MAVEKSWRWPVAHVLDCQHDRVPGVGQRLLDRLPLAVPLPRSTPGRKLLGELRHNLPPLGLCREPQRSRQRRLDHPDQRFRREPSGGARLVLPLPQCTDEGPGALLRRGLGCPTPKDGDLDAGPAIAVQGTSARFARVDGVRCLTASPMISRLRTTASCTAALNVLTRSQRNGLAENHSSAVEVIVRVEPRGPARHGHACPRWVQALDGGHVHTAPEEVAALAGRHGSALAWAPCVVTWYRWFLWGWSEWCSQAAGAIAQTRPRTAARRAAVPGKGALPVRVVALGKVAALARVVTPRAALAARKQARAVAEARVEAKAALAAAVARARARVPVPVKPE